MTGRTPLEFCLEVCLQASVSIGDPQYQERGVTKTIQLLHIPPLGFLTIPSSLSLPMYSKGPVHYLVFFPYWGHRKPLVLHSVNAIGYWSRTVPSTRFWVISTAGLGLYGGHWLAFFWRDKQVFTLLLIFCLSLLVLLDLAIIFLSYSYEVLSGMPPARKRFLSWQHFHSSYATLACLWSA